MNFKSQYASSVCLYLSAYLSVRESIEILSKKSSYLSVYLSIYHISIHQLKKKWKTKRLRAKNTRRMCNGRTRALKDFHRELESMCVSSNASRALKLSLLYTFEILLDY
jgi:hypothetical protein